MKCCRARRSSAGATATGATVWQAASLPVPAGCSTARRIVISCSEPATLALDTREAAPPWVPERHSPSLPYSGPAAHCKARPSENPRNTPCPPPRSQKPCSTRSLQRTHVFACSLTVLLQANSRRLTLRPLTCGGSAAQPRRGPSAAGPPWPPTCTRAPAATPRGRAAAQSPQDRARAPDQACAGFHSATRPRPRRAAA